MSPATSAIAEFIGGFVAAEGCFTAATGPRKKFTFAVGLGATDADVCRFLHDYFGVGHIFHSPRRKPHYDDEVIFSVQSLRDHTAVVIPFMDEHLPESYKHQQYLVWKERLLDYWEHGMKRRRPCTIEGCETMQRAHGLCRHHLYEQYGC